MPRHQETQVGIRLGGRVVFPQRVGRGQVSIGDTQGKKRFVFSYTDFVPAAADTLSAACGEPGARRSQGRAFSAMAPVALEEKGTRLPPRLTLPAKTDQRASLTHV